MAVMSPELRLAGASRNGAHTAPAPRKSISEMISAGWSAVRGWFGRMFRKAKIDKAVTWTGATFSRGWTATEAMRHYVARNSVPLLALTVLTEPGQQVVGKVLFGILYTAGKVLDGLSWALRKCGAWGNRMADGVDAAGKQMAVSYMQWVMMPTSRFFTRINSPSIGWQAARSSIVAALFVRLAITASYAPVAMVFGVLAGATAVRALLQAAAACTSDESGTPKVQAVPTNQPRATRSSIPLPPEAGGARA